MLVTATREEPFSAFARAPAGERGGGREYTLTGLWEKTLVAVTGHKGENTSAGTWVEEQG